MRVEGNDFKKICRVFGLATGNGDPYQEEIV
jgi:hypothetical protein